jgi:alkylated DNA repair dioxygenase AlkB
MQESRQCRGKRQKNEIKESKNLNNQEGFPTIMDTNHSLLKFDGHPVIRAVYVFEDSVVVPGFVASPNETFAWLQTDQLHGLWTDPEEPNMRYRGHALRRQKFFLNLADRPNPNVNEPPSVLFKYTYPAFQHGSFEYYRPFEAAPPVKAIIDFIGEHLTFNDQPIITNHCIGTRYRDANDEIGYHSDKIRNFVPNTPIVSVSLGEEREFHVGRPDPKNAKKTIFEHAFVLHPGDLFVLGPMTNARHRHAIVPVSDEKVIKREPGVPIGQRISLVLRRIATTMTLEKARKLAQKTEAKRHKMSEKEEEEEEDESQ